MQAIRDSVGNGSTVNVVSAVSPRTPRRDQKVQTLAGQIAALQMSPTTEKKAKTNSDPGTPPLRQSGSSPSLGGVIAAIISPRASRKKEAAIELEKEQIEHIQRILMQLNCKFTQEHELFQELDRLIQAQPTKEVSVKSLESAASDVWRCGSKLIIVQQICNGLKNIVDRHPDAENDDVKEDILDLNKRFLQLISCFQKGHQSQVVIPDAVEWKSIECLSKWIREQEALTPQLPLSRFIRSCSQERYSGFIPRTLLLNAYGKITAVPVPILAKVQSKQLRMTRTFYENSSNKEAIEMPIDIFDRATDDFLVRIQWLLQFNYDSNCQLVQIQSNAFLAK